jgi:threonine dehydratase
VFLKCELSAYGCVQDPRERTTQSSRIPAADRERGVVAYSSESHAQAVALACRLLGIKATIVMPNNAAKVKRAATEGYGARIVEYDPATAKREEIARGYKRKGRPR